MPHLILLSLLPPTLSITILIIGGAVAFLLTYLFTFGVIALARKTGWVEPPVEGKIHTAPMPRIGGLGIYVAFVVASLVLYTPFFQTQPLGPDAIETIFGHPFPKELVIYTLFLIASALIVAVHLVDDIRGLKPRTKMIFQTIAVIILLGPGFHYFHGVLFFGVHNPFPGAAPIPNASLPWYKQPELTLFIHQPIISVLAIPAVLFTWFWMVGMMNAVNFMDGQDGLAAGLVAIAGLFITIISWRLGQYTVALLSIIFTGAVAGFLPHNWSPARIWMGDTGSQFLGIALAMLAVIGGAKFALLLLILGLPILDIAWVMFKRIRRGQHPMQRDELPLHARETHLHYRLLFGGLSTRQICLVFYGATILLGLAALLLPTVYKFLGIVLAVVIMALLLWWSGRLQTRQEAKLRQETALTNFSVPEEGQKQAQQKKSASEARS